MIRFFFVKQIICCVFDNIHTKPIGIGMRLSLFGYQKFWIIRKS